MKKNKYTLTKTLVLDFLKENKLMSVATFGEFPWIAIVYYTFDNDLNLYFLSSPSTLHCKQIKQNGKVSVAIVDSHQGINSLKRGLQIYGIAKEVSGANKIQHVLKLWKDSLEVDKPELSYQNMVKKVIKGRMFQILPKRIKLFDQKLFQVEDGEEPVLEF